MRIWSRPRRGRANRKYLASAIKAMQEGSPEIAQLFMEAAGAETTHALNHLKVMSVVKREMFREALKKLA
jgi:rubrerythrin